MLVFPHISKWDSPAATYDSCFLCFDWGPWREVCLFCKYLYSWQLQLDMPPQAIASPSWRDPTPSAPLVCLGRQGSPSPAQWGPGKGIITHTHKRKKKRKKPPSVRQEGLFGLFPPCPSGKRHCITQVPTDKFLRKQGWLSLHSACLLLPAHRYELFNTHS